MADIVGSFQRGQQLGTQQRQQRETEQRRGRLSELAQLAYGAQPMQRQELVRQAIGVDPGAGFELDQDLQKAGQAKMQELVNSARMFINAPEASRPGLMQALRPRLEELGLDVPDYTPDSAAQFLENAKAFVATHGGGGQANLGDRYRVIGGSLVDLQDPTRAVYQAPQRFQTEQGLIEVGPEGAREIMLGGGGAQVGGIGEVQPGTGFSIGADIPPEVAAQIAAQERAAGGVQVGAMPGQRILPRGAGAEQERLNLARQSSQREARRLELAEAEAARKSQGGKPELSAGEAAKVRRDFKETKDALNTFKAFDSALGAIPSGPGLLLEGEKRGRLGTAYNNARAALRIVYNTGVLQPGELPMLESALRDPTSFQAILDPRTRPQIQSQLDELYRAIATSIDNQVTSYPQIFNQQTYEAVKRGGSAGAGLREVSTQAEYDALPSGAMYLEDGVQYRKP